MARPLALLGLLCLCCTSGQIGGEIDAREPTAETASACVVLEQVPILPEDASVEFDIQAVIRELDGLVETDTLVWGSALPASVLLTPMPTVSSIEVQVSYIEGTLSRLRRETLAGAGPTEEGLAGSTSGDTPECEPLLAFDANVAISMENGALADTFRAQFIVWSGQSLRATFEVMPGQVDGTFDLRVAEGMVSGRAYFDLDWTDGQLSGCLSGSVSDGDATTYVEVARFPKPAAKD